MPEPTVDHDLQQPDGEEPASAGGGNAPLASEVARPDASVATAAELDTAVETQPTRRLGIIGWLSVGWLVLIVGAALLAPILPIPDPNRTFPEISRQGPIQPGHILGGDANGRDMLSRVIWGARPSLMISTGAVVFGLLVGGFLGLLAGYFRGKLDAVLSMLFNVLLSIPALVLALALVAVFALSTPEQTVSNARRMMVLIFALGLVSIAPLGRITRAGTMSWSEREFVKAAQVTGARATRIIFREVLPNVWPAMMSIAFLSIAVVIVFEGSLAILGVGVQDVPSWGNIIAIGRNDLSRAPHIVFIPSIAIFLTVLALNYIGDVLRARSDVRESVL
jgi:peptide/nickel transport system permease protein